MMDERTEIAIPDSLNYLVFKYEYARGDDIDRMMEAFGESEGVVNVEPPGPAFPTYTIMMFAESTRVDLWQIDRCLQGVLASVREAKS